MEITDRAHKAFERIYGEAEALLKGEIPSEIRDGLKRIQSVARYELDTLAPRSPTSDNRDS